MEKVRDEVVSNIRACLISTKGKITLRQLENDYRTLLGEKIPYPKLGFKKLEDFLASVPTVHLSRVNGEFVVDAAVSEKSSHISDMVMKQKNSKPKRIKPKHVRFARPASAPTSKWRPKNVSKPRTDFSNSPRAAAVSHKQFVQKRKTPSVPSKIVIPERSTFNNLPPRLQKTAVSERLNLNRNVPADTRNVQCDKVSANNLVDHSEVLYQSKTTFNNTSVEGFLKNYNVPVTGDNNVDLAGANTTLTNAKKRITKKMSELSLECDSGTSSPTSDFITSPLDGNPKSPTATGRSGIDEFVIDQQTNGVEFLKKPPPAPKPIEFDRTGDDLDDLNRFVKLYSLGELEIKYSEVKGKKYKPTMYHCMIKVGTHTYTSYPNDFTSKAGAEKFSCKQALDDLVEKYGKKQAFLLSTNEDILERVPPMLEKHQHGIWSWQLEEDYVDMFQEQLPCNWLEVIDTSDCISIERVVDKYVLRHCAPGDKGTKWRVSLDPSEVSVASNTVQFGDDGRLVAQVTCVTSVNEIWCWQCDTPEFSAYSDAMVKMETFYNLNQSHLRVKEVNTNSFYVVHIDNAWYRAKVFEAKEHEVSCFLIDYGDIFVIPKTDLYQLKRQFATMQAQAFLCRLVGLEDLDQVSLNSRHLQTILYRQVILEAVNDDLADDSSDRNIPVVMYDYNNPTKSLNEELIELVTLESASPQLEKDMITEVNISNIEGNGDIYVQVPGAGMNILEEFMAKLEERILEDPPTHVLEPVTVANSKKRLYFCKYKMDNHWYRIELIDWSPRGDLAQVYFVDYGNTDVIKVSTETLYPLDKLNDILAKYPPQAIKVRLALDVDEIPSNFTETIHRLIPSNTPTLLKIVSYDSNEVPIVELFKRSVEGGLFCINKSIAVEQQIKKEDDSPKKKKVSLFADLVNKNVPSGGSLPQPYFPKTQTEYFNVMVPFAVNPWNFIVQPLDSSEDLKKLMSGLQERYRNVQHTPLTVDEVKPGRIYASKHEDGIWYRTSVLKVIHSGSISVFYCDFGYYGNVSIQQLVPLDQEFMALPYQALKARLAGIKPKQQKWTVNDCTIFKNMVTQKAFVSVIKGIDTDELYKSDVVLEVILIDVSTDVDRYIHKDLIDQGIAVITEE